MISRPQVKFYFSTQIAKEVGKGCHFTFHRQAFPRKPFRKPMPQCLHRKAFHELPHRQSLNDKSAKTFPSKQFWKPFLQNRCRKTFYEPPVPSTVAPSGIVVSALAL
ncbi:hypothetical protein AVEN_260677-1 [Araneus ventricosus]|uniref:Uncharacterized protein n=1 Tax=Araneus ventricosus TaxID=182803 RepID=A0A4Y2NAA3_ARAVE|nr:hypothetical protein AVEN_260677-1 [Araneus ventricosus]